MGKKLSVVEMVKRFQCPGCMCGLEPGDCQRFKLDESSGARCLGHVSGIRNMAYGRLALGLPTGFCRYGIYHNPDENDRLPLDGHKVIRLWAEGAPRWDMFNVPVWKLRHDGFLFVHTFSPRINQTCVDVLQDVAEHPGLDRAIDVTELVKEMD